MSRYLRYAAFAAIFVAGTSAVAQRATEITTPAEYPLRATSGTLITAEMIFPAEFSSQPRLIAPTVTMSVIISPTLSMAYALDPEGQPAETRFMVPPTKPIMLAQRTEPVGSAIERPRVKRVIRRASRTEKPRRSKVAMVTQQPMQRCHGLFACLSAPSHAFQPAALVTVDR